MDMIQHRMTLDHTLNLKGSITIVLYENGMIVKSINVGNLIVNLGKQVFADIIGGKDVGISYIAVGRGDREVTPNDISLQQEIGRKNITMKSSYANQVRFDTFFDTYEMNGVWKETALISSDNRLVARALLSNTINKTSSNTSTISWVVTFQ
jgi:hypothetical protein